MRTISHIQTIFALNMNNNTLKMKRITDDLFWISCFPIKYDLKK